MPTRLSGWGEECASRGRGTEARLRREAEGVAQSRPVCPLNGWLYPRSQRQDLGPVESSQAAQTWTSLSGEAGGVATVTGLRPEAWPLPSPGRESECVLRAVGARQGPARGGPAFSGLRVSPKSLASSSRLRPWVRAKTQTPCHFPGCVDGQVGGATHSGPLGYMSVTWPLRSLMRGPQPGLSPDREAGLGCAPSTSSFFVVGILCTCSAPLAPAHCMPGAPRCDGHSCP